MDQKNSKYAHSGLEDLRAEKIPTNISFLGMGIWLSEAPLFAEYQWFLKCRNEKQMEISIPHTTRGKFKY